MTILEYIGITAVVMAVSAGITLIVYLLTNFRISRKDGKCHVCGQECSSTRAGKHCCTDCIYA